MLLVIIVVWLVYMDVMILMRQIMMPQLLVMMVLVLVVMVLQVQTAGLPQLQLGDRIKIGTFDNLSISNKEYWVIQIDTSFDGAIKNTLTLREAA